MHLGNARTALYNYLFARRAKGKFILRIEDTDPARSKTEYLQNIKDSLKWLGLCWDEGPGLEGPYGPYSQSQKLDRYRALAGRLVDQKKAYPKEGALWFKVEPGQKISFLDLVRGKIEFDSNDLKDFVILRSNGLPTYHLAVVIDDYDMKISHVIRGEDLLSSTPWHILLQKGLGFTHPHWGHLPLIVSAERHVLSKREMSAGVLEYKNQGYPAQALVSFLALLGWHPSQTRSEKSKIKNQKSKKTEQEIFSLDQLIGQFELGHVQKGKAVFDRAKLNSISRRYILAMSDRAVGQQITPLVKKHLNSSDQIVKLAKILKERLDFFGQASQLIDWLDQPDYPPGRLIFKKSNLAQTKQGLTRALTALEQTESQTFENPKELKTILEQLVSVKLQAGDVFWPTRVALAGLEKSPPPEQMMYVLGRAESLARLASGLKKLTG